MTRLYNNSIADMPMTSRIRRLPISPRGYPVPWFVAWVKNGKPVPDGTAESEPDFRCIGEQKIKVALTRRLCWICGETLGVRLAFVIGPMCAINRVISEPPSHRDCAIFSATACPFLSQPRMRRNEKDLPLDGTSPPGFGLKRNPGVACVWITKHYRPFNADAGRTGILFRLGDPIEVLWFAEGRQATRREVLESIDSGYPNLIELAEQEGPAAIAALAAHRERAMRLLPKQEDTHGTQQ